MITTDVKKYIDKSVLCWLATSDSDNFPNVSPKEMFTWRDDATLLIAHLTSPNSIRNIKANPKVCVSFVDVFVQKGYKLKGIARLIDKADADFAAAVKPIINLFTDKYPVQAMIEIAVTSVLAITAPSYFLYPATTETSQVASAMKTYHVLPENK
jgi:predicted pyridoxine 5'-phosphate oxidase superfamily flavin-nucleotide-binding protein